MARKRVLVSNRFDSVDDNHSDVRTYFHDSRAGRSCYYGCHGTIVLSLDRWTFREVKIYHSLRTDCRSYSKHLDSTNNALTNLVNVMCRIRIYIDKYK